MHCPTCGANAPTGQKYCRSCGMDLQIVSTTLAEHVSTSAAIKDRGEAEKALSRRMIKNIAPGGVVLFIGLIVFVVGKQLFLGGSMQLVGTLVGLAGTFMLVYGLFSALLSANSPSGQVPRTTVLARPDQVIDALPVSVGEPTPSVTERTTALIGPEDQAFEGERPDQDSHSFKPPNLKSS